MLVYTEQGKGSPLVFLHGNPDTKECWEPIMDELKNQFHCIAVDLPGFGTQAQLPRYRDLLPHHQADSLLMTLETLGVVEPVVLVVHDLGAYMAASMLMTYPEKVRGLVSINTTFSKFYFGHLLGYLWALPILGPVFAKAMQLGFAQAIQKESPLVKQKDLDRMIANLTWTTCRSITRYYQIMYNPLTKVLQLLSGAIYNKTLPVKVVWGVKDRYIPFKYAQLHDEPVVLIQEATHWAHIEKPDVIISAVKDLMAEIRKEG